MQWYEDNTYVHISNDETIICMDEKKDIFLILAAIIS